MGCINCFKGGNEPGNSTTTERQYQFNFSEEDIKELSKSQNQSNDSYESDDQQTVIHTRVVKVKQKTQVSSGDFQIEMSSPEKQVNPKVRSSTVQNIKVCMQENTKSSECSPIPKSQNSNPKVSKGFSWNFRKTLLLKSFNNYNKEHYEGQLNEDFQREGKGKLQLTDGSIYQGQFHQNKRWGKGKQVNLDGSEYSGQWKNDKYHGQGLLRLKDGYTYQGHFKKGVKSGYGEEINPNGSSYKGYYKYGLKHGKGTYQNEEMTFIGEFKHDEFNGKGKFLWTKGLKMKGIWRNNELQGWGVIKQGQNYRFEGYFKDSQKHGQGILFKNGKEYAGNWEFGLLNGDVIISQSGKKAKRAIYENGRPISYINN